MTSILMIVHMMCIAWLGMASATGSCSSTGQTLLQVRKMNSSRFFADASECAERLHIERDDRWTPFSKQTLCHHGTPDGRLPASWFQENCDQSCARPAVSAVQPMCPSCCSMMHGLDLGLGAAVCKVNGREKIVLTSGISCCCPPRIHREEQCVGVHGGSSQLCPEIRGGGGGPKNLFRPRNTIPSVTEKIPGFATQRFPGLPGVPYVNSESDAAGHDIRASHPVVAERISGALAAAISAVGAVTLQGKTLPASAWYLTNTVLASPEQFPLLQTSYLTIHQSLGPAAQRAEYLPVLVDNPRRFRDTDYATEVWFHNVVGRSVAAFNAPLVFARVRSEQVEHVAAELDHRVAVNTSMFWLDLRDTDKVPAQSETGKRTKYAVGAVVLLEFRRDSQGAKVLCPIAVRLGTLIGQTLHKSVFVRGQSSESSWRFALLAAACAFSQVGVGFLHIFAYHVHASNFQWHFYNSLSSEHRLHNALKHMTKYTAEFDTNVLLNVMPLEAFPYHNVDRDQRYFLPVFAAWERLSLQFPYFKLLPSIYLAEQGIQKEDFSVSRDWDLYPLAKFQLECEAASTRFVGKLVDYFYVNDAEVQSDVQLQEFVAAMRDPGRGNVQVSESGEVVTRRELKRFLAVYMFGTIVHGSARMRQYIFQGSQVPNFIASFMDPELIIAGGDTEYSIGQMMTAMPDTKILLHMTQFMAVFQDIKPIESDSAFPNGKIDEAALPYECGALNSMWLDVLSTLTEIFAEGYFYRAPASEISQWPLNQEA
eukprot:TRINITY_DN59379_c0_g1_i1.p1 TRINITY_DN59379_c0_g1~~TRINITY_DN59379_c0_g1_i1.p1  ORF type:complete len:765 (+),score=117.48 TRINITY_DN59379_c0_g1_i1:171-2465(+)